MHPNHPILPYSSIATSRDLSTNRRMLLIRIIHVIMITLFASFIFEIYYMIKYLLPKHPPKVPFFQKESRPTEKTTSIHSRLTFLHIPKTGGTTIEYAGGSVGLPWGICMFKDSSSCHPEDSDDSEDSSEDDQGSDKNKSFQKIIYADPLRDKFPIFRHKQVYYQYGIGIWHLPSQFILQVPNMTIDPYQNADLFAVVRNPYTKMLSEYYFYCSSTPGACDDNRLNDPAYMNQFLQTRIQKQASCPTKGYNECYFQEHGHYIPQYDYIYDDSVQPPQRRVQYVLRSEHLNEDFASLMKTREIDLDLSQFTSNRRSRRHTLQVQDFTSTTVELIQRHYANDFALGGYSQDLPALITSHLSST